MLHALCSPGSLEKFAKKDEPELVVSARTNTLLALSLDLEPRPAVIVGVDGLVAVANSAMITALQRSREDFCGLPCDALFAPECRAQVQRILSDATEHNEIVFDTTCATSGGILVPVTLRLRTTAPDARGLTAHLFTIIAFKELNADPVLADGVAYVVSADPETFGTVKRAWGPSLRERPSPIGCKCCDAFCSGEVPCQSCSIFAKGLGREGASTVVSRQVEGKTVLEVVGVRPISKSEISVTRWRIDGALMSAIMSARIAVLCAGAKLSARESEVFQLLLLGRSVDEIAKVLHIVPRTAKYHQRRVLCKVGAESRFDLPRLLL
jgi:DNA-binding CsgD family transcriptional regulator